MHLSSEIVAFLRGPVLTSIGTRDATDRPAIARGSGAVIAEDGSRVTLLVSGFLWPDCVANLRDNGMVATTFVRPDDYRAIQLKGRAQLRPARDEEIAQAEDYVAASRAFLAGLGVPGQMTDWWLTAHEIVAADLTIDRAFEQTPGPRAGRAVT